VTGDGNAICARSDAKDISSEVNHSCRTAVSPSLTSNGLFISVVQNRVERLNSAGLK
jgi:hypothetical protein